MKIKIKIERASPTPVYVQIKNYFNEYIRSKGLVEGDRLPTLHTISKSSGVSLKTAERGMNELVKDGVCFRMPKIGTFVGNPKRQTGRKKVCGVFHASGIQKLNMDVIQKNIYEGISSKVAEYGKDMILMTGDIDEKLSFYYSQPNIDLAGMLMINWAGYEEGLDLATRFPETKFIYIHHHIKGIENTPDNVYGVYNDDFSGAYQITDFFIRRSQAKRIALLGIDTFDENHRNRISGYYQALKDNNIALNKDLVKLRPEHQDGRHDELAVEMIQELLDENGNIDTVICLHDKLASSTFEYLKTKGLEKDIQVSGFDNVFPEITRDLNLNTVSVDFNGMGEKAVDLLFQKSTYFPKTTRLTPQLLIRNRPNS